MLCRIVLSAIVIIGVFFTMQIISQGVGPAIQDDLAIQQVTDPGASRLLRTTQETQNFSGLIVFFVTFLIFIGIWKKPFVKIYKEAAGNTESGNTESGNTESGNTESVKKE